LFLIAGVTEDWCLPANRFASELPVWCPWWYHLHWYSCDNLSSAQVSSQIKVEPCVPVALRLPDGEFPRYFDCHLWFTQLGCLLEAYLFQRGPRCDSGGAAVILDLVKGGCAPVSLSACSKRGVVPVGPKPGCIA